MSQTKFSSDAEGTTYQRRVCETRDRTVTRVEHRLPCIHRGRWRSTVGLRCSHHRDSLQGTTPKVFDAVRWPLGFHSLFRVPALRGRAERSRGLPTSPWAVFRSLATCQSAHFRPHRVQSRGVRGSSVRTMKTDAWPVCTVACRCRGCLYAWCTQPSASTACPTADCASAPCVWTSHTALNRPLSLFGGVKC